MNLNQLDSIKCFFLCLKILAAALLAALALHFMVIRIPPKSPILPVTFQEPEQQPTTAPPFTAYVEDQSYQITPKATYKITGLVVALHDSAFMDITHAAAKDFINTHDICVIWGDNIGSPYLKDMSFTHGDWTCYFSTKSNEAWQSFNKNQISNNHILPANKDIEKIISSVRIGDQIQVSGMLVDYSSATGSRKTSLIRTDTENGACEIIYVTEARILSRGATTLYLLQTLAEIIAILALLGMIFSIFILPKLQRKPDA